ncbi:MAG: molybdopterin-dependent oxidoreductase [Gammaproteobacteria bacterium]
MSKVNRRDFLKFIGAGGAGSIAGFLYGESTKKTVEYLVPQVVPPEDYSPGIATWYNTVCNQCSAGCGIMVRTREGRAKKIEGNPAHPINEGRLCPRGQAGLNNLYNPDRVRTPLKRTGERGSGEFEAVSWDQALGEVTGILYALKDQQNSERVRLLTGPTTGHLNQLYATFMAAYGSPHYQQYVFDDLAALREASKRVFGDGAIQYFDLENADYVLSFGADYLANWLSPVHYSLAYGNLRQGGPKRGTCVQIEPRMSLSGASADQWFPARPGTEILVALAIANAIVENHYNGSDRAAWRTALRNYRPKDVAAATGLAEIQLIGLAKRMASAENPVAISGGPAITGDNGVATSLAVLALNYLAGSFGRGVTLKNAPEFGTGERPLASFADMLVLRDAMSGGDVDALLISETNPVYTMPQSSRFADALAQTPTIIALSSFIDDTSAMADFILPTDSYLEAWGDDVPEFGTRASIASIQQPVVERLYDTKSSGHIMLELARRIGGELTVALPNANMEEYIRNAWRQSYKDDNNFDQFWRDLLEAGVSGRRVSRDDLNPIPASASAALRREIEASAAVDSTEHAFYLQPYLTTYGDGSAANLPWIQELPDPLTSVVYNSWVELNPQTAEELGIREGDVLALRTEHGSLEAPAFVYPGIRPDVVAMPIGQGHKHYGRYADNRGANPLDLLGTDTDEASGALVWAAVGVEVTKTGRRVRVVKLDGVTRTLGRQILHPPEGSGHGSESGHG